MNKIHLTAVEIKATDQGIGLPAGAAARFPSQAPALCGQKARGNFINVTNDRSLSNCDKCLKVVADVKAGVR